MTDRQKLPQSCPSGHLSPEPPNPESPTEGRECHSSAGRGGRAAHDGPGAPHPGADASRGSARTGHDTAARSRRARSRSPSNAGFQVILDLPVPAWPQTHLQAWEHAGRGRGPGTNDSRGSLSSAPAVPGGGGNKSPARKRTILYRLEQSRLLFAPCGKPGSPGAAGRTRSRPSPRVSPGNHASSTRGPAGLTREETPPQRPSASQGLSVGGGGEPTWEIPHFPLLLLTLSPHRSSQQKGPHVSASHVPGSVASQTRTGTQSSELR